MPQAMEAAIPAGFTEGGVSPIVSERVVRTLERIPPRGGPIRLLVVQAEKAKPEALEELLKKKMRWAMKKKAPGVFEVEALPADVDELALQTALIRRLDLATRFFGARVEGEEQKAVAAVTVDDAAAARKGLAGLGAEVKSEEAGPTLVVSIPGKALASLAVASWVRAVEIREAGKGK